MVFCAGGILDMFVADNSWISTRDLICPLYSTCLSCVDRHPYDHFKRAKIMLNVQNVVCGLPSYLIIINKNLMAVCLLYLALYK